MPSTSPTGFGATEIFRMPAADSTVPDLMGAHRPASPTLTIVKGPQIGKLDVPYRRDDTIQVVSIAAEGLGR